MTVSAIASPARPAQAVRPGGRPRARVRAFQTVYAVQTPVARARRKAVARIALVALALGALAIVAPRAIAGDEPGATVHFDTYTVAQGESLWSIASALTPAGEQIRETMVQLKDLNAMDSGSLRAGEQIAIPMLDR